MKNKIKKLLNIGLDINMLKIIAVIAMIIDYIGYYFQDFIPQGVYTVLRIIGRVAMPIFTYCIVQGFFHTKNFKKYLKRITVLAVVTQVLISILGIINIYLMPQYTISVYKHGNILFSFALGLVLLYIIHNKIVIKKWDYNKNMILKIFYCIAIIAIYIFIPIDYEFQVILLMVMLYFIEKLKISTYLTKQAVMFDVKKIIVTTISEEKIKLTYNIMILLTLGLIIIYMGGNVYMFLSLPFIWLYNGEKKDNKYITSKMFYYFYPIYHVILYSLAIFLNLIDKYE